MNDKEERMKKQRIKEEIKEKSYNEMKRKTREIYEQSHMYIDVII